MNITIPELCVVALVGASGSGKSVFGAEHFAPTEVLSSDFFRGLVSDDENNQAASEDAFAALYYVAGRRLQRGHLTVIDATNVQQEARRGVLALAKEHDVLAVAIVLDVPESVCHQRNHMRADRSFGPHVVRRQVQALRHSIRGLQHEGFRYVYVLRPADIEAAVIQRQPLWTNRSNDHGPFDIIGDVHGCYDELVDLLTKLGYSVDGTSVQPPPGRRAVFLGDLVDRGPKIPDVLRLVMQMVSDDAALCIPGNHEVRLMRKLRGRDVKLTHGLAETMDQLGAESSEFRGQVEQFIDGLISHYVLDDRKLVVAHAGMPVALQGRSSGRVREFALYGETTGEVDEYGLPVRYNWAGDYRGSALVVYGHTPVPEATWLNDTICVDTGCVFGGALTALRYPERELVSVAAQRMYYEPAKPLQAPSASGALRGDDDLNLADVLGGKVIPTRLRGNVTIRQENAAAALEVMTRFAVEPHWLPYLPPTMSPCETSGLPDYLEHPTEVFSYFRGQGVERVVCQEKHMGSRALVIVCRDEAAARRRFGPTSGIGMCYTRTGRRFLNDRAMEASLLSRVRDAAEASGLWDELGTDWMVLDCELMPWSLKAEELIRRQYAATGAAAGVSLAAANRLLSQAVARGIDAGDLLARMGERQTMTQQYVAAYRHYVWDAPQLVDLKLAPFHLLASEGRVHTDRDHVWHMETIGRLADADTGLLVRTPYQVVDVRDETAVEGATAWWVALTEAGGEGMVAKPLGFVERGPRGLVQPALKCRGREYLRIIYGPEYTLPDNLQRLKRRGLAAKRSLALREFSLGLEGLQRFVERAPLWQVHQCAFGVLALESEPVDPRL